MLEATETIEDPMLTEKFFEFIMHNTTTFTMGSLMKSDIEKAYDTGKFILPTSFKTELRMSMGPDWDNFKNILTEMNLFFKDKKIYLLKLYAIINFNDADERVKNYVLHVGFERDDLSKTEMEYIDNVILDQGEIPFNGMY